MATRIEQINTNLLDPRQYLAKDVKVVGEYPVTSKFDPNTDTVEFYIYDINRNIISYTPEFTQYKVIDPSINQDGLSTINIDVEEAVKRRGFEIGTYNVVFNFFRNQLNSSFANNFFIKEISSNRTELRISSNLLTNDQLQEQVNQFIEFNSSEDYFADFIVNFGDNNQYIANNILLDTTDPNNFSVLIKLYSPLPLQFEQNDTLWVSTEVADPRAFKITFESQEITTRNSIPLRGPDYNISIKDQTSNSTDLQSINDILGTGTGSLNTYFNDGLISSSYDQLQNILNKKGININIDYTSFSNFCHFSSAEQRLANFYYKVGLIESASTQISESLLITSSYTASNDYSSSIENLQLTITNTIKTFDGYDNFLYYNSESLAWPKSTSSPPFTLYGTGSAQVLAWYGSVANENGLIFSASLYDEENQDNLVYTIPEYLREDPSNKPYELFIEMMGQYFDELYLYADDITNKHNADNRLNFGISKDIVGDVLKSFGINLYENNFSSDDIYASLLGINSTGLLAPPTGSELILDYISASTDQIALDDVNKETYKRIYHNMPYLLKKKGTVEGLRTLVNTFGIPTTVLRVNEFGGKNSDVGEVTDNDYYQNKFNYGVSNVDVVTNFKAKSEFGGTPPETVAFRFKYISGALPANDTAFNIASSSGAVTALRYKGSNGVSASFTGSILSASEFNGELTLGSAKVSASFFNGDWWQVVLSKSQSVEVFVATQDNTEGDGLYGGLIGYSTSSQGNAEFVGDEFRLIGVNNNPFAYQELRFYNSIFTSSRNINDLAMNPYSVRAITADSGSIASKNQLFFRAPLGSELEITRSVLATNYTSFHPAITGSAPITNSFSGSGGDGDSNYQFSASNGVKVIYNPYTQSVYYTQPYVGLKNRVTEKIKIGDNYTIPNNTLSPFRSVIQESEYSYGSKYGRDVNKTEVAFSPTNEIDDDIISTIKQFNIGEYIGDPNFLTEPSASYPGLDTIRNNYFIKYYKSYEWRDYVRLIKYFDNSLFKMIQDFSPAKSTVSTGIVIKQHLLERNKYPTPSVSSSSPSHPYILDGTGSLTGEILVMSPTASEHSASAGTGGSFEITEDLLLGSITQQPSGSVAATYIITGSGTNAPVTSSNFIQRVSMSVTIAGTSLSPRVSVIKFLSGSSGASVGDTIRIPSQSLGTGGAGAIGADGGFPGDLKITLRTIDFSSNDQTILRSVSGLNGSNTEVQTDNREFYNGELLNSSSNEILDGIQATNQIISSSMVGPIPFVSSFFERGMNGGSTFGLFAYESEGIKGLSTFDAEALMDVRVQNIASTDPTTLGKSVHFLRKPTPGKPGTPYGGGPGVAKIVIGINTSSAAGNAFTQSLDNLGNGDHFFIKFTQMTSSLVNSQSIDVPYKFTIGTIEKTDPNKFYTIVPQGGLGFQPEPAGGGESYIFSHTFAENDKVNGVSYGSDVDITILVPQFSINEDGNVNIIPAQNAQLLLDEANPIGNSINEARRNATFQEVDYDSGIITPTNISQIEVGGAKRAAVQDSNYTKTGHVNARYEGTRVSSPDFNIRSKIN